MRRATNLIVHAVLLMGLCLSMLAGCIAPMSAPSSVMSEQATEGSVDRAGNDSGLEESSEIRQGALYVEDQVILTGLADDIERLAVQLAEQFSAERLASIRFDFLPTDTLEFRAPYLQQIVGQIDQLEIVLFQVSVPDNQDMRQFLYQTLYPVLIAAEPPTAAPVLADLNYVMLSPEVGGLGNSVGAHPSGSVNEADVAGNFLSQWALADPPGIGRYGSTSVGSDLSDLTGKGVDIIVFDTSPFDIDGTLEVDFGAINLMGEGEERHIISITNSDPFALPSVSNKKPYSASHGLFVLALAHAVAPGANLELVRVLDDNMRGTMFQVADAMVAVMRRPMDSETAERPNTIFNLSLGGPLDDLLSEMKLAKEALEFLESLGLIAPGSSRPPRFAMETVVDIAAALKILTVASSGNQTLLTDSRPRPAQIPAANSQVVAVGASTDVGGPACYSNSGIVSAPGGHGGRCLADSATATPFDAGYGLLSLVLTSEEPPEQYYYWSGTSFAAPLVSGLAALIFESGADVNDVMHSILQSQCPVPDADGWVVHAGHMFGNNCP